MNLKYTIPPYTFVLHSYFYRLEFRTFRKKNPFYLIQRNNAELNDYLIIDFLIYMFVTLCFLTLVFHFDENALSHKHWTDKNNSYFIQEGITCLYSPDGASICIDNT